MVKYPCLTTDLVNLIIIVPIIWPLIQSGYMIELTRLYQEFLVNNPPNINWLTQDCGQTNQEL